MNQSKYILEMVAIGKKYDDDVERWYKMNWFAVSKSHDMNDSRGRRGHVQRQRIRHGMWKVVQKRYPEFSMYKIPYSIRGGSPCQLKVMYKIRRFINKIFRVYRK